MLKNKLIKKLGVDIQLYSNLFKLQLYFSVIKLLFT